MLIYKARIGFRILQIASSLFREDRGEFFNKSKSENQFVFSIYLELNPNFEQLYKGVSCDLCYTQGSI